MAMLKTARAQVFTPRLTLDGWDQFRQITAPDQAPLSHQIRRAAREPKSFLSQFDPDRYLLTHATIISSVDVDEAPNVKLSSEPFQPATDEGESPIIRPWSDYLIKPECSQYVNQNGDAWERKLLMATYKTFCGAENYLEHVQIPSLSKGKIIDAVARVLQDTVYIDILVATDRAHAELVSDILNKIITAMSMGCTIQFSICTRCGNVAYDETQLCAHVKHSKRLPFQSAHDRKQRIVAELCGHHTDPSSVRFIEASWVKQPAFEGAVARNILNAEFSAPGGKSVEALLQDAHRIEPWHIPGLTGMSSGGDSGMDAFLRTASLLISQNARLQEALMNRKAFGFDEDEDAEGGGEAAPAETPAQKFKRETKEVLRKELEQELRQEIVQESREPNPELDPMPEAESGPENSLIQSSRKELRARVASALSGVKLASEAERRFVARAALALAERPDTYRTAWSAAETPRQRGLLLLAMRLRDQATTPAVPRLEVYAKLAQVASSADPARELTRVWTTKSARQWARARVAHLR
jgi:hypothetical protein